MFHLSRLEQILGTHICILNQAPDLNSFGSLCNNRPPMEGVKANISFNVVVAALFATVTYSMHVSPPRGFTPDGSHGAKSVAFYVFFYSNFLIFWFALGLLSAGLAFTVGVDSLPGNPSDESPTSLFSVNKNLRWMKMVASLQLLALPMLTCAGIAMVAAGFISQEGRWKGIHAWISVVAACLVQVYTSTVVMRRLREFMTLSVPPQVAGHGHARATPA